MKISNDVIWMLTKKNNAHIVKFNGQHFSKNPLNLTNLHNRSASGIFLFFIISSNYCGSVSRKGRVKKEEGKEIIQHPFDSQEPQQDSEKEKELPI